MEWKEGLPDKSGTYVCYNKFGEIQTLPFSNDHKAFNANDWQDSKFAMKNNLNDSIVKWVEIQEFLKTSGLKNEEAN